MALYEERLGIPLEVCKSYLRSQHFTVTLPDVDGCPPSQLAELGMSVHQSHLDFTTLPHLHIIPSLPNCTGTLPTPISRTTSVTRSRSTLRCLHIMLYYCVGNFPYLYLR